MVTVGVGAALIPDYEGSDDYRWIPAGAIRGKVDGFSFTTRGSYFYFDAIPHRGASKMDFDFGPIAGVRLNRKSHIDDDFVKLLPHRNIAVEVGGFAGVSFHGVTNPYDTLALRLDVLRDVGNAHKSTTFSPNLEFSTPLSRRTYASANVGAEFVGNRFADYYFSISPDRFGAQRPSGVQRRRRDEGLEGGPAAQPVDYRRPAARLLDFRHRPIFAAGRRLQTLADRVRARQRQPMARGGGRSLHLVIHPPRDFSGRGTIRRMVEGPSAA